MRIQISVVVAVAMATVMLTAGPSQAGTYTVTDVITADGTTYTDVSTATINASGQFTGYVTLKSDGSTKAFVASAAGGLALPLLPTLGGATSGSDINTSGCVTGTSVHSNGLNRAFLYIAGSDSLTDLGSLKTTGSPSSRESWGYGINADGYVVGLSAVNTGSPRAFVVPNGEAMTDLGELATGQGSEAHKINSSKRIVGAAVGTDGNQYAAQWTYNGSGWTGPTQLMDSGVPIRGNALGVSDSELIVGVSDNGDNPSPAFVYNTAANTVEYLPFLAGYPLLFASGMGINPAGTQVVGAGFTAGWGSETAVLWTKVGGVWTVQSLNSLLPAEYAGWDVFCSSGGINDKGDIVALANDTTGKLHAIVMSPVPEPATMAFLAIGGLTMMGAAIRRRRTA
ncbi:MAG: PEP-CTERM sorting domain-containing protein [Phycisphaerae bacterium]|nr:PEP-CTERM sorting domain-containing protein [Phycisphaerae bacterium]